MAVVILDPTGESGGQQQEVNPGLGSLEGKRVVLFCNHKPGSLVLAETLAEALKAYGAETSVASKTLAGRPASPEELQAVAATADAVVNGLCD